MAVRGGHGRAVLHMPTGAGKTRTAMYILSTILAQEEPTVVVWLAASRELLEQAAEAFTSAWSHFGNRTVQLLRFWGDHSPDIFSSTDSVIIAGLQKMHALMHRDRIALLKLAHATSLVVVDEAHQAIAPTYQDIIQTLTEVGKRNVLIGLTATPGRTWSDINADAQLSDFFDGRKITMEIDGWDDPVSYLVANGYMARPTYRQIPIDALANIEHDDFPQTDTFDYSPHALSLLTESMERNTAILNEVIRLITEGHTRIMLFSTTVRHAELMASTLVSMNIDGQMVSAATDNTSRFKIIRRYRKTHSQPMVLCNYGVLTTGFDAPGTSAAIIARPTKSLVLFSQMVGRATRGPRAGGNPTCTISTVVDISLPGFGDLVEAFTNWEDVWHASA